MFFKLHVFGCTELRSWHMHPLDVQRIVCVTPCGWIRWYETSPFKRDFSLVRSKIILQKCLNQEVRSVKSLGNSLRFHDYKKAPPQGQEGPCISNTQGGASLCFRQEGGGWQVESRYLIHRPSHWRYRQFDQYLGLLVGWHMKCPIFCWYYL